MALLAALLLAAAVVTALPPRTVAATRERAAGGRPRPLPLPVFAGGSVALAVVLLVPAPLGWLLAAPAGVVALQVVGRLEPAAARRRRVRLEADLPLVVDLMAVSLVSGLAPPAALAHVAAALQGPIGEELDHVLARLALGADPEQVWADLALHPQLGPLGRSLRRSARTGASVADALGRLGDELRAAARAAAEARARTIEVRASVPLGLCLLPAFVLIGIVPKVATSWGSTFLDLAP